MTLATERLVRPRTPGWLRYLNQRMPGETPHADDDFFTDGDHSAYTALAITGTADLTEGRDRLSVVVNNQAGVDAAGPLKALTASGPPVTLETAALMRSQAVQSTSTMGIGFTSGAVAASNVASAMYTVNSTSTDARARAGTLTAFNSDHNVAQPILDEPASLERIYMRCIWTAANTFAVRFSFDGTVYTNLGMSSFSKTMTPTSIILLASTSGGTNPLFATFEYLRVYEADLSA